MKHFGLLLLLFFAACTQTRQTAGETPRGQVGADGSPTGAAGNDATSGGTTPTTGGANTPAPTRSTSALGKRLLVGYWHNFDNGSGFIRLKDVSQAYDVIQVAFVETPDQSGRVTFTPYQTSVADFKADVNAVHAQNRKVLISIGGANVVLRLDSEEKRKNFVTSLIAIIKEYGFDGFDLDLEGGSITLDAGDTDFKAPKTPAIANMISAVRDVFAAFDQKLILTMAPEVFYVQVGRDAYAGPAGAFLPLIHGLRDILTFIHVQDYNTGPAMGLDNQNYAAATADFHVAMNEMLLFGFNVAGNPNAAFPGLRADQVVIGLPSSTKAAGSGFTAAAEVQKALRYLTKGVGYGGTYTLRKPEAYPEFRGLMTWSVNWDAADNFAFSKAHRTFLDGL